MTTPPEASNDGGPNDVDDYQKMPLQKLISLCNKLGIDTAHMLEKSDLVSALVEKANRCSSSSGTANTTTHQTYEQRSVSDLKSLCTQCGIDTSTMLEKKEFVDALRNLSIHQNTSVPEPMQTEDTPSFTLPGINLTKEQNDILGTCKPPLTQGKGHLVRVTAAAGTGKTTTLLCLALRAVEKGHRTITYLTFTKAAAKDGTRRLNEALSQAGLAAGAVVIDARTLHSCAARALHEYRRTQDPSSAADRSSKIWSDKKLKSWISETLQTQIEDFLQPCVQELHRRYSSSSNSQQNKIASLCNSARDQVAFFTFKTLNNFCTKAMSREDFGKKETFGRVYYPAKIFHTNPKKGEAWGFPKSAYDNQVDWYADQACYLWDKIVEQDIETFDFIMKRAQLLGLEIPGTILLLDESQDMDGCQVNWVADQPVKFAKHAYFVGDAAQSIYSFRGAKPEYLMDLAIDEEKMLTESWRFGPGIADLANLVLFAKENSDQTSQVWDKIRRCMKWKNWSPYRVSAGRMMPSTVTGVSLLGNWRAYKDKSEKLTLIARQNKTLFVESLDLFGFSPELAAKQPSTDLGAKGEGDHRSDASNEDDDFEYVDDEENGARPFHTCDSHETNDPPCDTSLPKIHLNGYGESSGRKAWLAMFKLIGAIYDLYKLSFPGNDDEGNANNSSESDRVTRLPAAVFPEFSGRDVSWSSFCSAVQEREMNKYNVPISVVNTYKHHTMDAVELFKREVVNRNYTIEEADIILTTCHAAKGMEWEHVQVAGDFVALACYDAEKKKQQFANFEPASKKMKTSPKKWKFSFDPWGDDLNLLYVACTRAKRNLSLPSCVLDAIRDFDVILEWNRSTPSDGEPGGEIVLPEVHGLSKQKDGLTAECLRELERCLISKFREEVLVPEGRSLADHLIRCIKQ